MGTELKYKVCRYCGLPASITLTEYINSEVCKWCGFVKYYCKTGLILEQIREQFKNIEKEYVQNGWYVVEIKCQGNKGIGVDINLCRKCKSFSWCDIYEIKMCFGMSTIKDADIFEIPDIGKYIKLNSRCPYYLEQIINRGKNE